MRWPIKKQKEWNEWFAWYPVQVGNVNVWLEKVERKISWQDLHYTWYEYREIDSVANESDECCNHDCRQGRDCPYRKR